MTQQSTLGLEALNNLSDFINPSKKGSPIEVPLEKVFEDPDQPRSSFDETSLSELADSIKIRGVKSPISLRTSPDGSYIINHGARRYRASKMAGKATIPAWIDEDYLNSDQIIENIHREALTSKEIAKWIGRRINDGKNKSEIAKEIGKSNSYVSQYYALLNLPRPIAEVFNQQQAMDVTLINDLASAWKDDAEETEIWIQNNEHRLSRPAIRELKEFIYDKKDLKKKRKSTDPVLSTSKEKEVEPLNKLNNLQRPASTAFAAQGKEAEALCSLKHPKLHVSIAGERGLLLFKKRPSEDGRIWISVGGEEREVEADAVKIISLSES